MRSADASVLAVMRVSMRPEPMSGESLRRLSLRRLSTSVVLIAALGAGLAACSSVGEPLLAMGRAVLPGSGTSASAPVSARAAPVQSDVPVSAAAQAAFDEAGRALRAGRGADAERGFRALALSDPQLGGPHANLGVIYRRAGKLAESQGELERAVQLNPKQPVYRNQLGITYRQQGAFAKAREAYEKAIALDPAYAAPLLNLGILSDLYLGDSARALELYGRYLALSPSGDSAVSKWLAELKNRKPAPITVSRLEKE